MLIDMPVIIYALTGAITGFAAGLFGIGGGLLLVPALIYLFGQMQIVPSASIMQIAVGTSLAIMIFTALAAVLGHLKKSTILWHMYHRLWPGIAIGTIIGSWFAHELPTLLLEKILGFMLLIILINMILQLRKKRRDKPHEVSHFMDALIGLFVGITSGLVGIGGGALIIPYLTFRGVDTRKISALSSACTLVVACIGTTAFIWTGFWVTNLPKDCIGYVYWPAVIWVTIPSVLMAPIGAKMTYILPVQQLKYAFAVLIFLIMLELII